jgi:hypothetical protein
MFTPSQQQALAAPLDRANVQTRSQSNRNLSYLEGWHVIAEANRLFGFDGWQRETLHCQCVIKLFNTFVQENPEIWTDKLKADITAACEKIIGMDDKFIDLAFEMGPVEGMTAQDVKDYIRFIADRRLRSLLLEPRHHSSLGFDLRLRGLLLKLRQLSSIGF